MRQRDTPLCSVKKLYEGKDHKLNVKAAEFKLNGKDYSFDPNVYKKEKIKCILNVPRLINSVKCKIDEIESNAIGGCTAYAF